MKDDTQQPTPRQPDQIALSVTDGPVNLPATVSAAWQKCERCSLPLSGWTEPTDCGFCDPLCPVFGTHGHLWTGDEDEARARYEKAAQP
jgi:hypothetical protein